MTQTCGYCGGTGYVQTPTHDRLGYPNQGPEQRPCEYCDGAGVLEDGAKLLPAVRHRDVAKA